MAVRDTSLNVRINNPAPNIDDRSGTSTSLVFKTAAHRSQFKAPPLTSLISPRLPVRFGQ